MNLSGSWAQCALKNWEKLILNGCDAARSLDGCVGVSEVRTRRSLLNGPRDRPGNPPHGEYPRKGRFQTLRGILGSWRGQDEEPALADEKQQAVLMGTFRAPGNNR